MIACVHCGHPGRSHRTQTRKCTRYADGLDDPFVPGARWQFCACPGFDDAVLPVDGPLEFGVHRQRAADAETAPAWPNLDQWASRVAANANRRRRAAR
jgi:hypothetical protein